MIVFGFGFGFGSGVGFELVEVHWLGNAHLDVLGVSLGGVRVRVRVRVRG